MLKNTVTLALGGRDLEDRVGTLGSFGRPRSVQKISSVSLRSEGQFTPNCVGTEAESMSEPSSVR